MPAINTTVLSKESPIRSGTYLKSTKHFYNASKLFEAQITEIFDYFWPTITALKNLRWQVNGYYHWSATKDNVQLTQKFVEDSDITVRPNLYRICIEQDWSDQEFYEAKSLLINLIACYEAWCESIMKECGESAYVSKAKKLQMPIDCTAYLVSACSTPNAVLDFAYYTTYQIAHPKVDVAHIQNYLKLFRYFKECRNNIAHTGGIADTRVQDAYSEISTMTKDDIDVDEFPEIYPIVPGGQVQLSLRGVVGFAQILLKLVSAIDTELIRKNNAVAPFISKVKFSMGKMPFHPAVAPAKSQNYAAKIVRKAYFKSPQKGHNLYTLLHSEGLIRP